MNVKSIAKICHEANKAYCESIGDNSQPVWNDAPESQRLSAEGGVRFCIANPDAPPSANHDSWLEEKRKAGWKYGKEKNPDLKEHPCFVAYDELPDAQKAKDALFKAIVGALMLYLDSSEETEKTEKVA